MKIAFVHDWFVSIGGAERVLMEFHALYPEAPIFTIVSNPKVVRQYLPHAIVNGSPLSRWGNRPMFAPLMPAIVEGFDFTDYDVVVSNCVSFVKGIIVRPGTRHISYCYSPWRPLWDRAARYERQGIFSRSARHILRTWDYEAAQRPDTMLAISQTAASRIAHYYRRDAMVITPPTRLAMPSDEPAPERTNRYLVVSRLVTHKQLDVLVHAFTRLNRPLDIIGDGPLRNTLQRNAGTHIRFLGALSDTERDTYYRTCRALVVPNEEDWGLTAVEAMGHGAPVIALNRGGSRETVLEGITGTFFQDPISEAIADAVHRFEATRYTEANIRAHAQQWSHERWAHAMRSVIEA